MAGLQHPTSMSERDGARLGSGMIPVDSLIQVQIYKIWIWAMKLLFMVTAHKPFLVQFMMLQLLFSHCYPMEHMACISLLNIFCVSKRHQPV